MTLASINKVYSVYSVPADDSALLVNANVTDFKGETYDCEYCTRDEVDPFPTSMNSVFQAWLKGNRGRFEVQERPSQISDVVVPLTISDRQFFQQLAIDGLITEAEALNAVKTGELPAALEGFIASLDPSKRFAARMVLAGATTFERAHPLVDAFGSMHGMTPIQIDDLWVRAASL